MKEITCWVKQNWKIYEFKKFENSKTWRKWYAEYKAQKKERKRISKMLNFGALKPGVGPDPPKFEL